jgi:hypothetical protein
MNLLRFPTLPSENRRGHWEPPASGITYRGANCAVIKHCPSVANLMDASSGVSLHWRSACECTRKLAAGCHAGQPAIDSM